MSERRRQALITVVLVGLASTVSFYVGAVNLVPRANQLLTRASAPKANVDSAKLGELQGIIQKNYLDKVESDKLLDGALRGMVAGTGDKYSTYMTAEENKKFWEHLDPTLIGIGVHVELSAKTGFVTIVSPIKGSPGERAGLKPGDAIVGVDDKELTPPVTLDAVVQLIRGKQGTSVTVKVRRDGANQPLTFKMLREKIEGVSTDFRMIDKEAGIGYLQVREFSTNVTLDTTKAIKTLKQQGMNRLIIDLRQNPGGLLNEAIGVSSLFVPQNQPVVHIMEHGTDKQTKVAKSKERFDMPLVLLVDGNSASAAEIFAGAIKDHKLGLLVGTKTFGKGSVQSFFELSDNSVVKLTTARYLTAGGFSIHEKGIEPDVKVENTAKVLPGDPGDTQLQEAIARVKGIGR